MKLEKIYKYIIKEAKLIPEIGEGSSNPFEFDKISNGDRHFQYKIDGEVRTEDG